MDQLNQVQNPNVSFNTPSDRPLNASAQKKNYLLWIVLAVVVAVGGLTLWYLSQIQVEPIVQQPSSVNQEAREDILLDKEIQETDLGDLDKEFQAVDSDLNNL